MSAKGERVPGLLTEFMVVVSEERRKKMKVEDASRPEV